MADPTLARFVEEALRSGMSRDAVQQALADAGWSKDHVAKALAAYAETDFPIPVPRPRATLSARDAFLYLVMFGMLYVSAYHLGALLTQFVNLGFPDPALDQYRRPMESIRWSVSSIVVAFPVFLFTAWLIGKDLARDPTRRTSAVRKWLTYLTLAVAASIVAGDLIFLLNSLLAGELTTRFVLKALIVAGIAGTVFGYYLWLMRVDDRELAR